jgi:hypothetical protein
MEKEYFYCIFLKVNDKITQNQFTNDIYIRKNNFTFATDANIECNKGKIHIIVF